MLHTDTAAVNEAAYLKLKPQIDTSYPKGHYVAINQGQIVADAAEVVEPIDELQMRGFHCPDVLVVEAGRDSEFIEFLGIRM